MRLMKFFPVLVLLSLSAPVLAASSSAHPAVKPDAAGAKSFGAWRYVCRPAAGEKVAAAKKVNAEKRCTLVQVQRQKDSKKLLFSVQFSPVNAGEPKGTLFNGVLVLPFGLAVGQPLQLKVDGATTETLAISTCLPIGCVAPFKVDGGLLKKVIAGKSVEVGATTAGKQHPVAFHIQTSGLAAGITQLEKTSS